MAAEDIMDKVFSFFSSDDLTDEKQNMLKSIGKELSQSKYAKFFKIRSEEADPSFSSFLFTVYKTIFPIKEFYKDAGKLAKLKTLVVESCIDKNIQSITSQLGVANLDQKAATMTGEALITEIQNNLNNLTTLFDPNRIATVNHRYELAGALGHFVRYDFAGFFKKFDPHFADGSFIIEPRFPAIKTILIVDQIGDFLTVTQALKPEEDWAGLLGLLKICEGKDLVVIEQFNTMIKTLREIHTSKILELMVQYTLRNPVWTWKHSVHRETIGEDWLEERKAEAFGYIAKINNAKKNVQIKTLTSKIFDTSDFARLDNYTIANSEVYRRKNVECLRYAEGLNYLKAFLDDFLEKEIKELCDILLIRGQWTNNTMSREMSEAIHILAEAQPPIADLDRLMGDDGTDGSRLRAAVMRIDRDPTQARYINSIMSKVNGEALEIISDAAKALIIIGKHLKNLIEDIQKKHPELLVNWRELNLASKEPITQRMVTGFKKINYFIQLMHLCTQ